MPGETGTSSTRLTRKERLKLQRDEFWADHLPLESTHSKFSVFLV